MTSLRIFSLAKAILTNCLMALDLPLSLILQVPVAEELMASLRTSSVAKALLTTCLVTLDLHLSLILQMPVVEE